MRLLAPVLLLAGAAAAISLTAQAPPAATAPPAAVPPAAVEGDWPLFRGNPAHTGVAAGSFRPASSPRLAWSHAAGEAPVESSAAIAGGAVYLGTGLGRVISLDLDSGRLRWSFSAGETSFRSSPLVDRGRVYLGDDQGVFHALSVEDGKEAWSFPTDAEIISSANLAGDRILFGSYDGNLYCLDRDGKLLWKLLTDGQVHAAPAVVSGLAFVSGCDGQLRAVDVATGREVSRTPLEGNSGSSPAVQGDLAWMGTMTDAFLAVDWRKGAVIWTFQDPDREFPFYASPALAGGKVIAGGRDKLVRALDARTGKLLWKAATKGKVDSSPAIAGGLVLVGSADGEVHAFDLESGAPRWTFPAGAPITASPAVADGRLVVGDEDGRVWCLDLRAPAGPPAPAGAAGEAEAPSGRPAPERGDARP